jgi:hypothetical protein
MTLVVFEMVVTAVVAIRWWPHHGVGVVVEPSMLVFEMVLTAVVAVVASSWCWGRRRAVDVGDEAT